MEHSWLKVNWGPTEYSPIVYIARWTLYLCTEGVHVYMCTCVLPTCISSLLPALWWLGSPPESWNVKCRCRTEQLFLGRTLSLDGNIIASKIQLILNVISIDPFRVTQDSLTQYHSQGTLLMALKGSFTIFLFLVRSHILNSNEVWYWWFCPEGPKNASNSRFLGFYFFPRDLDSQRTWDLDSRRGGP